MKNKMNNVLILLFFVQLGIGQDLESFYKNLDSFLGKNVKNGKVDYQAIKNNPTDLQQLITATENVRVPLSKAKDYQAFWINVYNLYVIKSINDNYPMNSPLDVSGFFDKKKHTIAGEKVTLNEIENDLLRAKFKDARFHFVLVCGALGCPPLISKAYKPKELESQLEQQTRLAINDDQFVKPGKKVAVSQIFEWYKEDFERDGKTIDFINKYRKEPFPVKTKLKYYTYNWNINKQ
jgi:hypothetical protein